VKPGNVMLTPAGELKVMDFGIARAAADDTLTQTGTVLGTAAYLSPEQAQGLPVDARSDLYSLGCVLHEMLTGRPPFAGESPVSIAYKHVNEDPVPPSSIRSQVPRELDAVTMRAMAKDPERRFSSASDMREALAAVAGGAPAAAALGATKPKIGRRGDTAVMPPVTEQGPPPGRPPSGGLRRWLPIALVAAALVALIGFALAALGDDGRQGRRRDRTAAEEPTPLLSVDQAMAGLEDVVVDGAEAGEISEEAGQKILEKANASATKYADGDLEGALAELGATREETDAALAAGQITSSVRADAIHEAIDLAAQAMRASPPAVEEESPPPDEVDEEGFVPPGQVGKDKGKGSGKDKGKGSDGNDD
jgi:eukaryotic-like serine/threonine-protein kinase